MSHAAMCVPHRIEQHIGWLEVSVQDGRGVDVLERAEDLVKKIPRVLVGETLPGVNDPVQISLHQLRDDVNVLHQ